MKQWMIFGLAFICVLAMFYAGFTGLNNDHQRGGMFFIFVGAMTVIGLLMDFVNHLRARRSM